MQHPSKVWSEPEYKDRALSDLCNYYLDYLRGRSSPASQETIEKYRKSLLSFMRSLDKNGDPLILASVTPYTVNRWVREQRERKPNPCSEDGIASRLSVIKTFTAKYCHRHTEMTTVDLLSRVGRIIPPEKQFPRLTDEEQERLLACFDKPTYEDIRNRAFLGCYLATGRRFQEILNLRTGDLDTVSGEFTVKVKGGDTQIGVVSPKALRLVKRYLRERPKGMPTERLWLTEDGRPLSYWGGQSVFRRLKERSGIKRLHAHLLRHHFAQVALEKGVERGALQDMLGHKTEQMSRRYAGAVRQQTAAKMMPKFSPL